MRYFISLVGALAMGSDIATSFGHLTAVQDVLAGRAPVPLLARARARAVRSGSDSESLCPWNHPRPGS
jgi:hypothetical protein